MKNIFDAIGGFFQGVGNAGANVWHALTNPDTPAFYTPKGWSKSAPLPAGAIFLIRSKGFVESIIRKRTKGWSNHAGVCTGVELNTIEAEQPKVARDSLKKLGKNDQCIIIYRKGLTTGSMIVAYAEGTLDKPYNNPGLAAAYVFGVDDADNSVEYCSEDATRAAAAGGWKISAFAPELTPPCTIANYCFGAYGLADGDYVYDTWNITVEDVPKTLSA
jgi:hypothetical protein